METRNIKQIIGMTAILLLGSMSAAQADNKGFNVAEKSHDNNQGHHRKTNLVSKNNLEYKQGKRDGRDDKFYRSSVIFESKDFTRTEALAFEPKTVSVPESSTLILFGAGLIGLFALRRKNSTHV